MPPTTSRPSPTRTSSRARESTAEVPAAKREVELKRARGEIACAECRRLKLKCTRTVPCDSCMRRGCGALCPNGSLTTGETTRSVDLATKWLHKQLLAASARTRELENAVRELQAQRSEQPHPLLEDLGNFDSQSPLLSPSGETGPDTPESPGMIAVDVDGSQRFFGYGASFESILTTSRGPKDARESTWSADLQGFRDAATSPPPMPVLPSLAWIQSRLPSWDRALYLCDVYVERARWLTTAVTPEQLRDEMLPIIYQQAPPDPTFDYFGPHPLALLYYTFALGALLDPAQPAYNAEAAAYSELGRASLSLERIFEKPSVLTVQCLHFTYLFSMMSGGNSTNTFVSAEQARCHHYQASRLAYQIGLHRDSERWGLSPAMVKRRRLVFWNLYLHDMWSNMSTGRPPSFLLPYIDCRFPDGSDNLLYKESEDKQSLDFLSLSRYTAAVLPQLQLKTQTPQPPTYADIKELDRLVHRMPLPLHGLHDNGSLDDIKADASASMVLFTAFACPVLVSITVHRAFFVKALLATPDNPLNDQYSDSFEATYEAARRLARMLRDQFEQQPTLTAYCWYAWTGGLSAGMVLGLTTTYAPRAPTATTAFVELEQLIGTFSDAAALGGRAGLVLPILQRLRDKAHIASMSGTPPPRSTPGEASEGDDELALFAGQTRVRFAPSETPQPAPPPQAATHPPPMYAGPGTDHTPDHPGTWSPGFYPPATWPVDEATAPWAGTQAYTLSPPLYTTQYAPPYALPNVPGRMTQYVPRE